MTLLVGVGTGVTDTGEELFEDAERDLWVSGGPIEIAPGAVGGFRNPVTNAHTLAAEIESHEDVRNAAPMGFQVAYVSADGEEFETILGSGVSGGGGSIAIQEGTDFSGPDTHYADGTHDGPMTHEVIVDPETAERFDLEVGDTIHLGGDHRQRAAKRVQGRRDLGHVFDLPRNEDRDGPLERTADADGVGC